MLASTDVSSEVIPGVYMHTAHHIWTREAIRHGTVSRKWVSSEPENEPCGMYAARIVFWKNGTASIEKWELGRGGERNQGEWEEEFRKRNTGRTTGRESWGTRRNMKTAAVDKSAGCGDTPAPWPGNSLPRSSAKTPFILRVRKKEQN